MTVPSASRRHVLPLSLPPWPSSLLFGCGGEPESTVTSEEIRTPDALERVAGDLLDDRDRLRRTPRLISLLEALPVERYPELVRIVESRAMKPRHEEVLLIMHVWAQRDPDAAYAQVLLWNKTHRKWSDPIRDHAAAEVLYVWSQDAGADVEAVLADAPEDLRSSLWTGVVRGWAESGQIGRATRFVGDHAQGPGQLLVTVLAERLVQYQGIDGAIAWAESLPESRLRTHAFRRTAEVVARVDPQRATAWVEEHLGERYAAGMARRVARMWARREAPPAALAWAGSIAEAQERKDALGWTFREWVGHDSDAAMAWVQQQVSLDPLFATFLWPHIQTLIRRDPATAVEWVRGFADEERVRQLEVRLAHLWLAHDREAAEAWIRESDLEEAVAAVCRATRQEARGAAPQSAALPWDRFAAVMRKAWHSFC